MAPTDIFYEILIESLFSLYFYCHQSIGTEDNERTVKRPVSYDVTLQSFDKIVHHRWICHEQIVAINIWMFLNQAAIIY